MRRKKSAIPPHPTAHSRFRQVVLSALRRPPRRQGWLPETSRTEEARTSRTLRRNCHAHDLSRDRGVPTKNPSGNTWVIRSPVACPPGAGSPVGVQTLVSAWPAVWRARHSARNVPCETLSLAWDQFEAYEAPGIADVSVHGKLNFAVWQSDDENLHLRQFEDSAWHCVSDCQQRVRAPWS